MNTSNLIQSTNGKPGIKPALLPLVYPKLLSVDEWLIVLLYGLSLLHKLKISAMKHLVITLILATTAVLSKAQNISGTVKDENGTPLLGATVSLLKDSSILKLAVTKPDGSYNFQNIKEGKFIVKATFLGYKASHSEAISLSSSGVTIQDLTLVKMQVVLKEVTISQQKPLVEVKADKLVMNVEGTINATGSNALELIRKSPGVVMDKDDNFSLVGKNGVQVLIDGKSSPLSVQDLAVYLKTLQSSQIEAIELITNPSAKYDASGNAGIINIKLVRNKSLGVNGSANAGWNVGSTSKYNTGAALNYRNKSINIFSTYSYSYSPNQQHLNLERKLLDSAFNQQGSIKDLRRSHNFKIGADYTINKNNIIGMMVNGILADPTSTTTSKTLILNTNGPVVDRLLVSGTENKMKRYNANTNFNYTYTAPKGDNLVINADHGAYDYNGNQFQSNHYYDPLGQTKKNSVIYDIFSPSKITINSIKADYEQSVWKGKMAVGSKLASVTTDNDFQRYDVKGLAQELDRNRSNQFRYNENINAGYVNYNRKYKLFTIQVGVRVENTASIGVSDGQKLVGKTYMANTISFVRSYTDFFPSAAISFNKNPEKVWGVTYSRRVDRPAYKDLNPFEFKLDEYTSMRGNVDLRSQYSNNFGVSHSYKYKLNMGLNYSRVRDMFTDVIDTIERSKAFVAKKNLATQDILNLSVSYPFQYKSYSLFTNISSNYSKYQADFGAGRKIEVGAFGFNIFAQNSLKFAKTWTAELSGFYNAPTIQGSFKTKSIYNVDAGILKPILKGKSTVKASVSDVFYSQRFRASSDFAGQTMNIDFRGESRQFKIALNYRFGNNGVKPARQRTTGADDESKRVQQRGGLMSN